MDGKVTFSRSGINQPARLVDWKGLHDLARYPFYEVQYLGNYFSDDCTPGCTFEYALFRQENSLYCIGID